MKIARPVLRYPGGKFKIKKWVISHFPPHQLYVETHGGAASVLMEKSPSQGEVYNDINADIVDVFRVLRDPKKANKLERLLRLTPFAYEEYRRAYQRSRDEIEMARRIIFRSFASIGSNGVTREHSGFRGLKNNETGVTSAQEWSRYPDMVRVFTERLKNVVIENRPVERLFSIYDRPTTLWYVDPPYMMQTRAKGSKLYQYEMNHKNDGKTDEQLHEELAQQLKELQGMVVLSAYHTPFYSNLYKGWQMIQVSTTAQNGKPRTECILLSPNIQPMLF
jgi:DNA adenine methylase